jgi:hypothetical protein
MIILLTLINAKVVKLGKRIKTSFTLVKLLCLATLMSYL